MKRVKNIHPIVREYRWGNITAQHALGHLGKDLESALKQGIDTSYIEAAIAQVLEIPEEPPDETEGRERLKDYIEAQRDE